MAAETIGVVGGGIVGLAVARELTRRRPGARVLVLEKEDRVATHQTAHSSGVVHAGIYYRPGSLKAELCSRGRALLREYCAEHALPYVECGKLVVAVDDTEVGRLDVLHRNAARNGVPGLRRLDAAGIADVEPHAAGRAALHSPATAITDFVAVAHALARDVEAAGGRVLTSARVDDVRRGGGRLAVVCGDVVHHVDRLVACAGLQADRVARGLTGPGPRIVPFRGEYLAVRPARSDLVRGLLYPVPDPRYPFLGVHVTRRVDGRLELGPNALLAPAREGYRRTSVSLRDVADALSWPGTWRLARQHWRTGLGELHGSLSVPTYLRAAQRYLPELRPEDVVRAGFGVRAQAVDRDGTLVDDFRILHRDGITSVRNAPSPAATSSLAIAGHVVDAMGL
jgi:L-2-hydroxyglutarate oxidase LhgO